MGNPLGKFQRTKNVASSSTQTVETIPKQTIYKEKKSRNTDEDSSEQKGKTIFKQTKQEEQKPLNTGNNVSFGFVQKREKGIFQSGYTHGKPTGNFIDNRGVSLVDNVDNILALGSNCASVCLIRFKGGTGTGFRVGTRYVMTALHVVMGMDRGDDKISGYCVFSYFNTNEKGETYEVRPDVCYTNEETDAAVIELVNDNRQLPPPFGLFGVPNLTGTFTFIGHEGGPMKCNKVELIIDKNNLNTLSDIQQVKNKSTADAKENYEFPPHSKLDSQHRILFHCQFSKGASGSPGVLVNGDGAAVVVTMLLCGYPNWYYDENFNSEIKKNWPKEYCIEQGADMMQIRNFMKSQKPDLYNDIFGHEIDIPKPNLGVN